MQLEPHERVASNHPEGVRFVDVLRRELSHAERADLAVSFLRFSGLGLVLHELEAFLARGGKLRLLTSTYLGVTQADALRALLKHVEPTQLKIFDAKSPGFHLKLFTFTEQAKASCWVGSSNLTRGGISTNLELNVHHDAPLMIAAIHREFELLWSHPASQVLTEEFIADYAARQELMAQALPSPPSRKLPPSTPRLKLLEARPDARRLLSMETDSDAPVKPNEAQCEALDRLRELRSRGEKRAVIIAAPGIGKTFLAAFDARAAGARRVLFVSHRLEHLRQAERTFSRVYADAVTALVDGTTNGQALDGAELVFGTVQSISTRADLVGERWDYVVVDEFHHAHAATYRAVITGANPEFLLGLTATPERQDGHDVLAICDYNVAYEVRLHEAIRRQWLLPFHYFGIADDTVDYAAIPWRSGRFDALIIEDALSVDRRVQLALMHALDKGYDGPRRATVGFCAGVRHAMFMAQAFVERGQNAKAITGAMPISERERIYREFMDPAHPLEWLFVSDVLNEGIDLPAINSILFLRPTDSATLFIQQLGRGLRLSPGCEVLTVIDLVGHHRRAWLSLTALHDPAALPGVTTVANLLHAVTPPPGCEIVLDIQTKEILNKVERFVGRRKDQCREVWAAIRDELGQAPYPVDFIGRDEEVGPEDFRAAFGTWIDCRVAMGDAEAWERALSPGAPLRTLLARCEVNWQAQRVYAYARLWASVVAPDAPSEGYTRFFERFPRWRAEYDDDGFDRADKTLDKKLGDLWKNHSIHAGIFNVISHERLILEVEQRLQYQMERDYRIRHGGVLRSPTDLVPWRRYGRPEIINHFGRQFDPARHNAGVITFSDAAFQEHIVIITKIDTSGAHQQYQYSNGFEDVTTFRWQSQNRNTPEDATGRRLVTPGAARIHLFVQERSHATAVYCGLVTPTRYEGSAPIDVWFQLPAAAPPGVMHSLMDKGGIAHP